MLEPPFEHGPLTGPSWNFLPLILHRLSFLCRVRGSRAGDSRYYPRNGNDTRPKDNVFALRLTLPCRLNDDITTKPNKMMQNHRVIYNGTALSSLETGLLAAWERERKSRVTLGELRQILGPDTRVAVNGLVQKGLLERIAPGLFLIHPFRSLSRPRAVSSAVVAAALLADEPYYLGGWWAFSLHRLTQQMYGALLDAYVTRERRPRRLRSATLIFHVLPQTAFTYGIATIALEGTDVCVSDAERTLLDALDYPRTFGDMRAALQLVQAALDRVDRGRLVTHAVRGSHPSTCQRLGVLLERRGATLRLLAPLARRIRETASLLSMFPDAPRTGPVNTRWRVVENDRNSSDHPEDEEREHSGPTVSP